MGAHNEFLELCAISTSGELTQDERKKLEKHLAICSSCREALRQYEEAICQAVPAISSALAHDDPDAPDSRWSLKRAEAELFARIDRAENQLAGQAVNPNSERLDSGRRAYVPSPVRWTQLWMPYAAGIFFALALGVAAYRIEMRLESKSKASTATTQNDDGRRGSLPVSDSAGTKLSDAARQLSDAGHERELLLAQMADRDRAIASLKRQLDEQTAELAEWRTKASLLSAPSKPNDLENQGDSPEAKRRTAESATLEARVDALQKQLTSSQEELLSDAATRTALEVKLAEQDTKITEQQDLLAHDRDIRELMGARDLYMAEVYDVAKSGQTNKPYGRVFYTKGKSLIFYAYDLDQQPGLKNGSSFQAWGRRGGEKDQPLNLGVFYEDSVSKKRWILKLDDPKTLAQIDAVFVTVEPDGGSRRPSTKPLLFAYLRIDPNHP